MSIQPHAANPVPPTAVVVTHEVTDFPAWKSAFDRHAPARRNAGVVATHVNRHDANPNQLSVYMAGTDRAKLAAFLRGVDLMTTMRDAGVKGPPHIVDLTPVEDLTRKDRPLPGLIVRHQVRDFDAWKRGFDAHAPAREQAGIIGHAVNRSAGDPNVVVVYLQAETPDALRAFATNATLKDAMRDSGVVGAPDLTFVQGGDWQS